MSGLTIDEVQEAQGNTDRMSGAAALSTCYCLAQDKSSTFGVIRGMSKGFKLREPKKQLTEEAAATKSLKIY